MFCTILHREVLINDERREIRAVNKNSQSSGKSCSNNDLRCYVLHARANFEYILNEDFQRMFNLHYRTKIADILGGT